LFSYSDEAKFADICNKLAMVALKVSKVEQCVDILMEEMRHGSPEKQKVVRRTLASVLMQVKDLSAEMAAVVSNILMYKMNCVYCYLIYSLTMYILWRIYAM
jgi:hypothetical protein